MRSAYLRFYVEKICSLTPCSRQSCDFVFLPLSVLMQVENALILGFAPVEKCATATMVERGSSGGGARGARV